MHVIAGKAVCLKEALSDEFKTYQKNIIDNAQALAGRLIANGLPLVSGGTDNHLMLVDLRTAEKTGKVVEAHLDLANITVNKNAIPFDPQKPAYTSGIRIGTPAVTSRGMNQQDMALIGDWITRIVREGEAAVEEVRAQVLELCAKYPLY